MSILRKQICIIPARGGSRRIKNKNIKKFNGKPIISYSIDSAKKLISLAKLLFHQILRVSKKLLIKFQKPFF